MSKSLIIALVLIAIVVYILLQNSGSTGLYLAGSWKVHAKSALVFLGFFMGGIITGLLLKNS
jgi:uncharacterized integral membrane protein